MEISRRKFFGLFGAVTTAAIVAPKTYIFAPVGGWQRSKILTVSDTIAMQRQILESDIDGLFYSNLDGLLYWQTALHSGVYAGISRGVYPGKLNGN